MKIKLLGAHNCETLEYRHTCLVIDDILAIDAGSLTPALSLEEQLKLEAVLLSHQHYDHVRDIIAFGTNLFHSEKNTDVYTTSQVIGVLKEHFFQSGIYRNLANVPEGNPSLRMNVIEPLIPFQTAGYDITAVPVNHSAYTVGYNIGKDGTQVFYTSDTGPDLKECWKKVSPRLLIIEVTESNASTGNLVGHLTPELLKNELLSFQEIHGYIPDTITVHMSPRMEGMISKELREVAGELGCWITPGFEGMEIDL